MAIDIVQHHNVSRLHNRPSATRDPSWRAVTQQGHETDRVACRDYRDHRDYHRWAGTGFVCGACEPATEEM